MVNLVAKWLTISLFYSLFEIDFVIVLITMYIFNIYISKNVEPLTFSVSFGVFWLVLFTWYAGTRYLKIKYLMEPGYPTSVKPTPFGTALVTSTV